MILAARGAALVRAHNERAWLAYHVAALTRAKKMPRYERLLIRRSARRQPPEQQLAVFNAIAAAHRAAANRK